jgi:Zn-dependent protease with chaperone function
MAAITCRWISCLTTSSMNKLAIASVAFAITVFGVAGCMVSRGPSKEQIEAQQEMMKQQMHISTDQIEAQMRQIQEKMEASQNPPPRATDAGQRAEQLRAAREQAKAAKAAKQENDEMMRNLRKDPRTAKALDDSEKQHKDLMRANPSGVQSQFNLGDREEASVGLEMVPTLIGEQKLLEDPALLRYLNSVGMWVAQQSERPGLPWQFAVIDSDSVNAFAVPGGYVFVTRGMVALLETESELAGVLGHEISHVVRKHHLRWIYVNKDMQASSQRAKASIRKYNPGMLSEFDRMDRIMEQQMAFMNSAKMRSGMGQGEEMQADTDGATLAWRAGYEAWGLVSALQRFEAYQRPRYAALHAEPTDHPEPLQRLKMLDLALRARAEKDTLGDVGNERYLAATRSLRDRGN